MQLKSFLLFVLLLFGLGVTLIAIANMFFYMMLGEVNGRLPADQQIGMLGVRLRYGKVLALHSQFYPGSAKPRQMKLIGLAGFLFIGTAFLLDIVHYGH